MSTQATLRILKMRFVREFITQLFIHANRGDNFMLIPRRSQGLIVGCVHSHLQSVGVTGHFEGGIAIQREVAGSSETFRVIYTTSTSDIEHSEQGR